MLGGEVERRKRGRTVGKKRKGEREEKRERGKNRPHLHHVSVDGFHQDTLEKLSTWFQPHCNIQYVWITFSRYTNGYHQRRRL